MIHISKVNEIIKGIIYGDGDIYIKGPCGIKEGKEGYISYIKDKTYLKYLNTSKASAIIIDKSIKTPNNSKKTFLKVDNAALAFIDLLKFYESNNNKAIKSTICKTVQIDESAQIGNNVSIGHNSIIGECVVLEDNVSVGENTSIQNNSSIGYGTNIQSNVVIYRSTSIGKNCKIKSGSIIGGLGFGLITDKDGRHHRIPHLGNVIIENNIVVGSNCTIDRGTLDNTIISNGTNIDNQVHIAHNVNIGENCLICAQVAIAGSTKISNDVIIGGQTGIIDNLTIGKGVVIGPRSYVVKSIKNNLYVSGNPARDHKDHVKQDIMISKLPEMYKKIFKK